MGSLENDKGFLKKSVVFNIIGTALKICGPLLTVLMARIFGPDEFGIFVSTQALILTIARAATLGLDRGLHWYLPQNKLHGRPPFEGIMESFWVTVFISLVATAVMIGGSLTSVFPSELAWYALSLVFYSATYVLSNSSEGNRKPWNAIIINDFLVAVLSPLSSIILHYMGVPHALPLGLVVGQVSALAMHYIVIHAQFKNMPVIPARKLEGLLLRYSIPLGLTNLVGNLLMRSTLWMVLYFLGSKAAGVYALMITISNSLQTIRNGFNPVLIPVISSMDEKRLETDIKPVYSYCASMATLIQIVIGFFVILFPAEIMSIAGKNFVSQPMALGILLVFQLVATMFGLVNTIIDGIGKSMVNFVVSLVQILISVVVGFLLIPKFGLAGAAFSMLAYGVVSSICCNVYLFRRGIQPYAKELWVECLWMTLLIILYAVLNVTDVQMTILTKIVLYVGILLVLGAHVFFNKRDVVLKFFKRNHK